MRAQTHDPLMTRVAAACLLTLTTAVLCGCNSMSGHMNNQMGMWNYERGNYTAAREEFHRAALDDPQNASFAYNLASAMKRQGDFTGAEQYYARAINLDPTHQPAYHGMAQLLVQEQRTAEATQLITSWATARPLNAGAQIEMAWIQRQNGDRSGAEQSLYRALAIRPDDPIATAHLGQIYQETGRSDRAMAMYQRSLRSNWMQPQVESRLAALRSPYGLGGSPPTMVASTFGAPMAGPVPMSYPTTVQEPTPAQTATAPMTNDDPAHVVIPKISSENSSRL